MASSATASLARKLCNTFCPPAEAVTVNVSPMAMAMAVGVDMGVGVAVVHVSPSLWHHQLLSASSATLGTAPDPMTVAIIPRITLFNLSHEPSATFQQQQLPLRADSVIVYKSTNLECFPDPAFAVNVTCRIKAVNWNKAVAQMDCDLVSPLANTSVQIEVFKKSDNNRYHPFLVNVTVNMCDVMSRRNFMPYGTIFWKIIKEHTNVNHSCPIRPGHLTARNLFIDESFLPRFPLGFYQTSLKIVENSIDRPSRFAGIIKYYFQVKEMVKPKKKG
ncbi:uncharacterized protein LOC135434384 [Drosophila montana]|uniref:uncharacterized protein LOC135434384 n=1 Tax=Drosophila montana TaxID=40370 RepID=UPI00313BD01E